MSQYTEQKKEIVALSQKAMRQGLYAGTSGNMSLFDRAQGNMLITPTSVPYDILTPDQIVVMKLDGTVVEGELNPSSEWRMHAAIYENFEDVSALFHTHSPYATAFAANRMTIPATLIEINVFLGGELRCAPYAPPGTKEVGLNAIDALRGRYGCTLANHGVLAVGTTLDEAYLRAEYIEDAARINAIAMTIGKPIEIK